MRIAFLGTPEFAVPSLQMLIDHGHALTVFPSRTGPPAAMGPFCRRRSRRSLCSMAYRSSSSIKSAAPRVWRRCAISARI